MSKKRELEALFDAIIVKPVESEEEEFGGIIVPDIGKEKNTQATVITVGPGKRTVTGELIPTVLKPGDVVILPTMGFTRFEFEGEEYLIGSEHECLGKIK